MRNEVRTSPLAFLAGLFSVLVLRLYHPDLHLHDVCSRILSFPENSSLSSLYFASLSLAPSKDLCSDAKQDWKSEFLYANTPKNLGRGLHYLCVLPSSSNPGSISFTAYKDAKEPSLLPFDLDPDAASDKNILMIELQKLTASRPDEGREYVLFDSEGNELFSER